MRRVVVFAGVLFGLATALPAPVLAQSRSVAGAEDDEDEDDEDAADARAPDAEVDTRDVKKPVEVAKPKTPVKEVSEEEILAPQRTDGPATSVGPARVRDRKVGVLAIVPLADAGKTLADQLTGELLKALNESASVEFTGLALRGLSGGATIDVAAAEASRTEGDQTLAKAKGLLGKMQLGKAKTAFEKAIAAYEKAAAVLDTPMPLVESWVGLAEVAARQANDAEVTRCFEVVIGYAPEFELNPKQYPGLFITTHRKVRDRLLKGDKAVVLVDATATGAQVVIDGRPTAQAPAKLKGLYPGAHLVRVLREGLAPWGAIVTVAAGAEASVSPGFFDPSQSGPGDDLAQNRFSAPSAAVVAEAARAANVKGGVVGVVSKASGRVVVQLLYVDAASGKVATLSQMKLQGDLLDIGIESLKARARVEELAAEEAPTLAEADPAEALIEGARAGAGVTLAEVNLKFQVKASRDMPAIGRDVVGVDDDEADDDRSVAESKTGSRKTLDGDKDRYSNDTPDAVVVPEDAPIFAQPWFMPTAIAVGAVVVVGVTGGVLFGTGVIPDPRPASGGQVSVTFPAATP